MDAKTKQTLLDILHKNELYNNALKKIQDKDEHQKIKGLSEDVFVGFLEGISEIKKFLNDNPEKVAEALQKKIHNQKKDEADK
jgi:hypothetical protein